MKRTINEIYDLIKQKKDNAQRDFEIEKDREKANRLYGELCAYVDVICLIESSQVLENE